MEIRPLTPRDLDALADLDATVHSTDYLHVDRHGEGVSSSWKIEPRPLREPRTMRAVLDDETAFAIKQIAMQFDDGLALVAEHDEQIVAALTARPEPTTNVFRVLDLRVDFDFRRQGLASAMLFQAIQDARRRELRALFATATADNFPAHQLLAKLGFEPSGLDTHLNSNHDLVKEAVTIFWYLTLN